METNMMVFSGNSNLKLAEQVSKYLKIPLGKARIGRFKDGECDIEILENVRGQDVFVIQSTCSPASENLVELLLIADALRRASAARITAVMPYFGYARQDRRVRSTRVPISAKVVADMIATVGIDRILTIDLHADQIQGFFYMPVDNIYTAPVMLDDIRTKNFKKIMIISPDVGGVVRARAFAKNIPGAKLSIIDKRRPEPNKAQIMHVIGEVDGHDCIIVDDIVDTAGTLCLAVDVLKKRGANSVTAYATHAVLSGDAIQNIEKSGLDELVVADTIPLNGNHKKCPRIRQISIAKMLAKAMRRVREAESLSSMFKT